MKKAPNQQPAAAPESPKESRTELNADNPYKCMRNPADGSMYYGEVAFVRRSNGQLIKPTVGSVYETEIKPLTDEERLSQFQMVRHGHGLQLFSGKANGDGVVTKYEGAWARDKKHGQGTAIFADGSTYTGKFTRDMMDGEGCFKWAQGHEYRGSFRDGQMDG